MFYSPLRYPGGKSKIAKIIAQTCEQNNFSHHFIEPYTGGASVALFLLITKKVNKITLNDYDRSIYALWYAILNQTAALCTLIEKTPINTASWKKAKACQKKKKDCDLLSLGFSTLFLNRTNRSGILNAGVIGGKSQEGTYKIDCRFNKQAIIKRINLIAQHKSQIELYHQDAIILIKKFDQKQTLFYFDPPYYVKGKSLYAHFYNHAQHKKLSHALKNIQHAHWMLSYDNVKAIREIYHWVKSTHQMEYQLFHRVEKKKQGEEILFFSDSLNIA